MPGHADHFLYMDFHFPEALLFRDELIDRCGLKVEVIHPEVVKSDLMVFTECLPVTKT